MTTARGLYDFEGQPSENELPFKEGAIITITNASLGNGWLEATDADGNTGFVPEAFVEILTETSQSATPEAEQAAVAEYSEQFESGTPVPSQNPVETQAPAASHAATGDAGAWNTEEPQIAPSWEEQQAQRAQEQSQRVSVSQSQGSAAEDWDEDDDDWDEDDEAAETGTTVQSASPKSGFERLFSIKSLGKFSKFAKMGGDAYILGAQASSKLAEEQYINIQETEQGPRWTPSNTPYSCTIFSPKKDSKMKGFKSFIVYQLTPSFSDVQVSRRFKHFDWLCKRLEEKFPCVCVPPLPEKQVTGRFEEDFIEERMRQLQNWLNRMLAHPAVAKSSVMRHFLSCAEDRKWKTGKRKAEKDEYQGAKLFLSVHTPPVQLDLLKLDTDIDTFMKHVKDMDDNNRNLQTLKFELLRQHYGPLFHQYQRMGSSFSGLAKAFEADTRQEAQPLIQGLKFTGETYNGIADLYREQPPHDLVPLTDMLSEYRGLLACFPAVLSCTKAASAKVREVQKGLAEGQMTESDLANAGARASTIGYTVRAEICHFEDQRLIDFQTEMSRYLDARVEFYKKLMEKYQSAADQFKY